MIAILVVGFASVILLLLLNRAYLSTELSLQRLPILERRTTIHYAEPKFLERFNPLIRSLLPETLLQTLESEYLYLGRKLELLYELIVQIFLVFASLFFAYLLNHNSYFLILALLIPALLIIELKCSLASYHRELEADSAHLFACARVLLINTETPMILALRIIVSTWPNANSATVHELNKIINKIDKLGAKEALSNWQVKSEKFRDFLSFLVSVAEGSSKRALRAALDKLIESSRQEEKDRLQEQADNLQLYLMGPVVAMLLVVMYPMAAAINFMMQNSLLKGDGI